MKTAKEKDELDKKRTALPEEVLKLDNKSVELYRKALTSGSIPDHDIRLMIVGHFGVGKTALRKRLLGEDVDINEQASTDGIEVHTRRAEVGIEDRRWRRLENTSSNEYGRLAKILEKFTSGQATASAEQNIVQSTKDTVAIPDLHEEESADNSSQIEHSTPASSLPTHADTSNDAIGPNARAFQEKNEAIMEELKSVVGAATDTGKQCASVSIWDFAGQSVFYATHQVFLSKRAVYLLVTDMSQHIEEIVQDDDVYMDSNGAKSCKISEFVEFWLNSIQSYCGSTNPNVILVGTHADKLDQHIKTNLTERYFQCVRNLFMEKDSKAEHVVEDEFSIDNSVADDQELERLKKAILDVASKQAYWGNPIPARWITLEKTFTGLRESGMKIMSREKLSSLNQALPVPLESEAEIDLFLAYHHELGTLVYFSEPVLRDNILLDPQWLINAIKCLITAGKFCGKKPHVAKLWNEFNTKAVLETELLKAVWENTEFWEHQEHMLRLMERLDLIAHPHQLDDAGSTKKHDPLYFVPCMLKEKYTPDLLCLPASETTSRLCFTTASKFIPTALFNRLLAACTNEWELYKQNGKPCIFCGCGIFLVNKTHRLTVCFRQDFVQIWIMRLSTSAKPDHSVCYDVRRYIKENLERILPDTDIQQFIKCPEAELDSMKELINVEDFHDEDEVSCSHHEKKTHILKSAEMLRGWFDVKEDSVPEPTTAHAKAFKMSEYYCRMGTLLLDICPLPLRELFIQEAKKNTTTPNTTLDDFLLANKSTITKFLNFPKKQKKTLYPASGVTDISDWDITLLSLMLLKLFPSLPQMLTDSITTIREERNSFQHLCNTGKMTCQDFTQKWKTLKQAVNGIGQFLADPSFNDQLDEKMKELKDEPLQTDIDSIFKHIQEWQARMQEGMLEMREEAKQESQELRALLEKSASEEHALNDEPPPQERVEQEPQSLRALLEKSTSEERALNDEPPPQERIEQEPQRVMPRQRRQRTRRKQRCYIL